MITPLIGNVYIVKHSSGMIKARFIRESVYNPIFNPNRFGLERRSTTHYIFQNLKSGRDIVLKSRVKIRVQVTDGSC